MAEYIIAVTIPVITAFILAAVCLKIKKLKLTKQAVIKNTCILSAVISIDSLILNILIANFTTSRTGPTAAEYICLTAFCFAAFIIRDFQDSSALRSFLKRAGIICIAVFLAESLFFNFKSFTLNRESFSTSITDIKTETPDTVKFEGDKIIISGNGTLSFDIERSSFTAVELRFDGKDNWFGCSTFIKDENTSQTYTKTDEKYLSGTYGKYNSTFSSYEMLHSMKLEFKEINEPVTISSIQLSAALPYSFSSLRFFFLLIICIGVCAVYTFSLYKTEYNRKSSKHKIAVIAAAVLAAAPMLCCIIPEQKAVNYDEKLVIAYQNPFIQMFDAVQNSRVNIDIPVDSSLTELENPYDTSLRTAKKVKCSWDRAYYNGKYYSYYGIAPVFTFYYPFYLITGKLPTINMASVFFGIIASLALTATILSFSKHYLKRTNLLLLLVSIIAAGLTSGIYFAANFSNMYFLPGIASSCFLFICLWSGFTACAAKSGKIRNILFIVCACAFILCLTSRPSKAVSALILAPVFLSFLFSKNHKLRSKVISVISFMVPIVVGACAIMLYNNARFDSPFEFGAIYQLTVNNVSSNHLRPSLLPQALMNYFAAPVGLTDAFPFVKFVETPINKVGQYIYSDFSVGAFSFPLILTGAVLLPFALMRAKKKDENIAEARTKKYTYATIALISVLVAWMDFCVGGIILSYVCDILPVLTLMSVFLILETHNKITAIDISKAKSITVFSAIAAINIILIMLEMLSKSESALIKNNSNIYFILEDLTSFWN